MGGEMSRRNKKIRLAILRAAAIALTGAAAVACGIVATYEELHSGYRLMAGIMCILYGMVCVACQLAHVEE
jgi:hypothetical protein